MAMHYQSHYKISKSLDSINATITIDWFSIIPLDGVLRSKNFQNMCV